MQKTQSSRIMEIPDKLVKIKDELRSEKHAGSICVANYKGGVGKTTMSCLLGYYLAKKGKKVLLIDIDPQCSLSLAVGFDLGKVSKTDSTIYDLVSPSKWAKIKKVKFNNYVDSIPDIYAPSTLKIIKGSFDVDNLDIAVIQAITDDDRNKSELFFYCLNMQTNLSKSVTLCLLKDLNLARPYFVKIREQIAIQQAINLQEIGKL